MEPEILFSPAARREIKKLSASLQRKTIEIIEGLLTTPRPRGVEKLTDYPGFLRLHVGKDHRLIYCIQSPKLIIILVIRDRKDAYRGLDSLKGKLAAAVTEIANSEHGLRLLAGGR